MSLFLGQPERYGEALTTFDPFEGEILMRWADRLPPHNTAQKANAPMPYLGLLVKLVALLSPAIVLSWVCQRHIGDELCGLKMMVEDRGLPFGLLYALVMAVLLSFGRRMLGDLANELARTQVTTKQSMQALTAMPVGGNKLLRFVERATRLTPRNTVYWFVVIIEVNLLVYWNNIVPNIHWASSPADSGSLLYLYEIGGRQPNLSGLWFFGFLCPLAGWLALLAVRLQICFACLCQTLASSHNLQIVPCHPDGSGGLIIVGQTALFLSLYTLTVGGLLTGWTMGAILPHGGVTLALLLNQKVLLATWMVYLIVGPLMFFLPMFPLHAQMIRAKRDYLRDAEIAYAKLDKTHRKQFKEGEVNADTIQTQTALGELIMLAEKMTVWPYDRGTLFRFAGVLAAPLVISQWERLYAIIEHYLHSAP